MWREGIEKVSDGGPEALLGPLGSLSQKGLQLREGVLDRIEVRGVGRQHEEACAGGLDGRANDRAFVGGKVVEDDDVSSNYRDTISIP